MKDSSCRRVVAYPHQFAHLKGEGGLWGPRFGRGFGLHGGATAWGWWLPRPSPWTRTPTSRGESSAESEGSSAEEEEIRAQRRRRHKRAQKQARAKTATDDDAATTIVSEGDDSEPDDWEGDEKDEEGDEQDELLHPDQLVNANTDDSEPDYLAELNKHEAALDEQLAAMSAEEDEEGDEEDVDGEEEDWEGDEEERVEALLSSVTGEPVCKWVREEEEDVGGSISGGGGRGSGGSRGERTQPLEDFGRFIPYQAEPYQFDTSDAIIQLQGFELKFQIPSAAQIISQELIPFFAHLQTQSQVETSYLYFSLRRLDDVLQDLEDQRYAQQQKVKLKKRQTQAWVSIEAQREEEQYEEAYQKQLLQQEIKLAA
jgi:hypothetical protein